MIHTTSLYGLNVALDRPVRGLPPGGRGVAEISVSLDTADWVALSKRFAGREFEPFRHTRDPGADPTVLVSDTGRQFEFSYVDGTLFLVDLAEGRVWGRTPPDLTLDDTIVYLLGPILGFVARAHGVLCLHASAVVLDGGAVAFAGPAGAGKSTTAAGFARADVPVLTDDISALDERDGRFSVSPGNSFLRLWPESTPATGVDGELPRLAPDWDKRFLDLTEGPYRFASEAAPLRCVYVLEGVGGQCVSRRLPSTEALVALVGTTYANYLLTDSQRAVELEQLSRLVETVEVRGLTVPNGLDGLPEVIDLVRGEQSLRTAAA